MSTRMTLIGLAFVALALVLLHFVDDGMATCELHHSFDVCHDSLN